MPKPPIPVPEKALNFKFFSNFDDKIDEDELKDEACPIKEAEDCFANIPKRVNRESKSEELGKAFSFKTFGGKDGLNPINLEEEDLAFADEPKMVKKQSNAFEAIKNSKNKFTYISFEKNKKSN